MALVLVGLLAAYLLGRAGAGGESAAQGAATSTTRSATTARPSATPPATGSRSTKAPVTAPSDEGPTPRTDPASGLTWVAESALPPQAQETLARIRAGGPYPYPRNDDQTFGNREGILPKRAPGYYREYTVETPGSPDRGARRIIVGRDGDSYYTDDHYGSFRRIQEGR